MQPHLTFVQLSDSHLGPTRDTLYYGHTPYQALARAIELINAMPQPPDFVVHTGDLSNDRSAESYELAAELLSRLRVPFYLVNGNHDDRALLRKMLDAPFSPDGDPDAPLDYAFEVGGERFLVLDGWSPEVRDPLGKLSDSQLARVRAEAESDGPPLTVLLHHPPVPMGSPWLDQHMPLINGQALYEALQPARGRLRGVFCGHLHRSSQIICRGITTFCGPSTVAGYTWHRWEKTPAIDPDYPPAYSLVHYFDGQVVVHQYAFARG
jgi:3',5'-cyclic AMP phosphodiesterase CpdA